VNLFSDPVCVQSGLPVAERSPDSFEDSGVGEAGTSVGQTAVFCSYVWPKTGFIVGYHPVLHYNHSLALASLYKRAFELEIYLGKSETVFNKAEEYIKHYEKLIEEKTSNMYISCQRPFHSEAIKLASIIFLLLLRLMFRNPIGPNSVTSSTHHLIGLNKKTKSSWSRHFVTSFFGSRHSKTWCPIQQDCGFEKMAPDTWSVQFVY
jgi:hypothetical protein